MRRNLYKKSWLLSINAFKTMISISFIVVLLAAYSYSLPINKPIDSTTSEIPFTTGETIVIPDATATPQVNISKFRILFLKNLFGFFCS